jgi:hypothetical protein
MSFLDWYLTFQQAFEAFDFESRAEDLTEAEKERAAILERYPLEDWGVMPLESFAQGAGGESFCSWLEHSSPHICRLPASSAKIHLIYKEGGKVWKFPKPYKNVKEAWEAIRGAYVEAFGHAENEDYAAIDQLKAFGPGRLTLHKALHVYFPDRFLPISAANHMRYIAQRVLASDWEPHRHGRMGHCELGHAILEAARKHPELQGRSSIELMYLLYSFADVRKTPEIIKIAPGEDAKFWDECQASEYICVGWDEVGDLRQYAGKNDFKKRFAEEFGEFHKGHRSTISRKANELWSMLEAEPGTLVLANKGASEILGIGRVKDPGYRWLDERAAYRHGLNVEWDPGLARKVPKQGQWPLVTVQKIEPWRYDELLGGVVPEGDKSSIKQPGQTTSAPAPTFDQILAGLDKAGLYFPPETVANFLLSLQAKRFVILTGISGTGKTQLAKAVAERFELRKRVRNEDGVAADRVSLTVMPYMLKYRRLVLPAALAAGLPKLASTPGSGQLLARYPGGEETLSVWTDKSIQVIFKGKMRLWFQSALREGDTFELGLDYDEDGQATALRFGPIEVDGPTAERVINSEIVAVRPDWTDNRGLLGYLNPLTGRYVMTPFLRLILAAKAEEERVSQGESPHPFFVILDEMNLARVEHYFSDFLSCLESGKALHLHEDQRVEDGEVEDQVAVPRQLEIPSNLYFIGTVNVDETTYMFSPKVLDRAFCIELNDVDLEGLAGRTPPASTLRLDEWDGRLLGADKPGREDWRALGSGPDGDQLRGIVVELHGLLAKEHRHFGYRVANEIARYVNLARVQCSEAEAAAVALDLALLQKVLPKLHGTQQEIQGVVDALLGFALEGGGEGGPENWTYEPSARRWTEGTEVASPKLPRTATKLWRMRERLRAQGFTAFIE